MENLEPTNAPLMVLDSKTEYGFFAIDPLGDTWIEALQIRPEARALLSLRLLCSDRASAGDHSITGERWPPHHGTEPAASQIVVSLQSPRQDHSG